MKDHGPSGNISQHRAHPVSRAVTFVLSPRRFSLALVSGALYPEKKESSVPRDLRTELFLRAVQADATSAL
jgi:hypothetical protein